MRLIKHSPRVDEKYSIAVSHAKTIKSAGEEKEKNNENLLRSNDGRLANNSALNEISRQLCVKALNYSGPNAVQRIFSRHAYLKIPRRCSTINNRTLYCCNIIHNEEKCKKFYSNVSWFRAIILCRSKFIYGDKTKVKKVACTLSYVWECALN